MLRAVGVVWCGEGVPSELVGLTLDSFCVPCDKSQAALKSRATRGRGSCPRRAHALVGTGCEPVNGSATLPVAGVQGKSHMQMRESQGGTGRGITDSITVSDVTCGGFFGKKH